MTYTDDFIPDQGQDTTEASPYPALFGITFTPIISGAIFAILGLGVAAYLLISQVQPAWENYQKLNNSLEEGKLKIKEQEAKLQQIEKAKEKLETSKKQQTSVLALFGSDQNLDTLLLDLNRQIDGRKAKLTSYTPLILANASAAQKGALPPIKGAEIVQDGSLGTEVNGKLKRRTFNLEFQGTIDQTQSSLRSIERLQSLLIIKDFKSRLDKKGQLIEINEKGKVEAKDQPKTNIETSFKLQILSPLTAQEAAEIGAAQAQAEAAKKPAAKTSPAPKAGEEKK
jgi:type IV pilus assembly protein PilO